MSGFRMLYGTLGVQGPKQSGFRAQIALILWDGGPKTLSFGSLDP